MCLIFEICMIVWFDSYMPYSQKVYDCMVYCLTCEAEARHMYYFSGVVVVVVVGGGGGGVNFSVLGHFLGNYKG